MTQRTFRTLSLIALAAVLPAISTAAQADTSGTKPKPNLVTPFADVRYRLETVDQDGLAHNATASTLRVRAGVRTAEWNGLSAQIEGEAITTIGKMTYNDTIHGKTSYPMVADPEDVLLNQAFLKWKPVGQIEAIAGQQAVNIDNQRWIGSVGWRQNDQTLDAARVSLKPAKGISIDYLYAWRVNRVFGPDSPQGVWHDTNIHGARAALAIKNVGTLSGYGYWLDIPASPASSTATIGLRLAGEYPLNPKFKLLYTGEYAQQRDHDVNPRNFTLDYTLAEGGVAFGPASARLGWERLEGNGVSAVQTPLATLHAFNGWADKFLTTPANGLRDIYVDLGYRLTAKGPLKGTGFRIAWHDFRSTLGNVHYGREWDASATFPVHKYVTIVTKVARYDADAFATDTLKTWLGIEFKI
jgi:hypothetical protein